MIDVRFTLKSGVQIEGRFDKADSLYDISLANNWVHGSGEFETTINTSQIAAMEVVARYS